MADRGKIMETRIEFWGQGYSQRSTYLYDSISMAFRKDSEKGTLEFVHNGTCTFVVWHGTPYMVSRKQHFTGTREGSLREQSVQAMETLQSFAKVMRM